MTISVHQAPNGTWVAAISHEGRTCKLFSRHTSLEAINAARDWLASTPVAK